jgi:hypothetical protein
MVKSKRSKACEFSRNERDEIYKRDKGKCIFCGSEYQLTYAHLVPRSKSGRGIKENGALVCLEHHMTMDNPIGHQQVAESKSLKERFRKHLDKHYPGFTDEERKYRK